MLNFDFLENGLGTVPPLFFVYDFSKRNITHNTLIRCFLGDIEVCHLGLDFLAA